jgi:hypothetical protein
MSITKTKYLEPSWHRRSEVGLYHEGTGSSFLVVFGLYPLSKIVPLLRNQLLHLNVASTRRKNGRKLGTFEKKETMMLWKLECIGEKSTFSFSWLKLYGALSSVYDENFMQYNKIQTFGTLRKKVKIVTIVFQTHSTTSLFPLPVIPVSVEVLWQTISR